MIDVDVRKTLPGLGLEVAFTAQDEIVGLFGPTGTGKTLTLRLIAGLLSPDAGRIVINGRTVVDAARRVNLPVQQRRIGYVSQRYALFPHLSVAANIAYGLFDLPAAERQSRVADMVGLMRLKGLESRRPSELSGGQQQRVALARALVARPDILLLDEPFAACDSAVRSRLYEELQELHRRYPITTILVTHDLAEACSLATRLVVMDAGHVLQSGAIADVLYHPACRTTARFVGVRNFLEGQVVSALSDHLRVQWGRHVICARKVDGVREGDMVTCCVRPEDVEVMAPGDRRDGDEWAVMPGAITRAVDRGAAMLVFVAVCEQGRNGYDFEVSVPTRDYHRLSAAGSSIVLAVRRDHIHLLAGGAREPFHHRRMIAMPDSEEARTDSNEVRDGGYEGVGAYFGRRPQHTFGPGQSVAAS